MCHNLTILGKNDNFTKMGAKMELWDLLDAKREPTGRTHERGTPVPAGCYYLVTNVWIVNRRGEFLITKRDARKTFGGLWECQGGAAQAGEDSLTSALREAREETGVVLDPKDGRLIEQYTKEPDHHYDVWLFRHEFDINKIVLQEGETADAWKVTQTEIRDLFIHNDFVPHLYKQFEKCVESLHY